MAMVLKRLVGAPTQLERGMSMSLACAVVVLLVMVFALGLGVRNLARPQPQLPTFVRLVPLPPDPPESALPEPETNARMPASESTRPPPPPRDQRADASKNPPIDSSPAPVVAPPTLRPATPLAEGNGSRGSGAGPTDGAGSGASAAKPGTEPARWVEEPDDRFFDQIYPERARAENVTGSATIRCELLWNRRVRKCRIISETPARYGFGRAVLEASPRFRLYPPKKAGQIVRAAPIDIRLEFDLRKARRSSS